MIYNAEVKHFMTEKSKTELAESLGDHLNLLKLHHNQNAEPDHAVNSIFSAMDELIHQVYKDSLKEPFKFGVNLGEDESPLRPSKTSAET